MNCLLYFRSYLREEIEKFEVVFGNGRRSGILDYFWKEVLINCLQKQVSINYSSTANEVVLFIKLNPKLTFVVQFFGDSAFAIECFRKIFLLDKLDP